MSAFAHLQNNVIRQLRDPGAQRCLIRPASRAGCAAFLSQVTSDRLQFFSVDQRSASGKS